MKKIYTTPDLELIALRLNDVVLVSTESSIPEDINPGGGEATEFSDDDL